MQNFKRTRSERPKQGLTVTVHNNNVVKAWKKLKRRLQEEGISQEIRDRRYYEKPSEKRKKAKNIARKRWQKKKALLDIEYGINDNAKR